MQNGLMQNGYNANMAGADLAAQYGTNLANIYTGMGNAQGAATMAQSAQRRGLFGDIVDTGFRVADKVG